MSTPGANPLPDNSQLPYSVIIRVGDLQDGFRGLLFFNVQASSAITAAGNAMYLAREELGEHAGVRMRASTVLSGHHPPGRAARIWFGDDLDL